MKKLLRIGEASQILEVSVSTLRGWKEEGKLKPIRIGKQRSYDYNKLTEFLGQTSDDAVAIVARLYGLRANKIKKAIKELKDE